MPIISSRILMVMMFFLFIIALIFLCIYIYLYSHKDDDIIRNHYSNYMDIPENDGVHTWLPDFFPSTAKNISIYTNIEGNYFYSYFYLIGDDDVEFRKSLAIMATQRIKDMLSKNDNSIKNVWCKYGEISGEGSRKNLYFIGEINAGHYYITHIRTTGSKDCVSR